MKKIIKKILGEQKTPKFDYIRKVAKLIAYYDIEVDIENRNIAVPFVGVLGQTEYYNSEPFLVYYKDDYLITNEIPVYVFNKYGLDIKNKRGLHITLVKLIDRYLNGRINNMMKPNLNEGIDKQQRFFDFIINKIVSGIKWKQISGEYIETEWPMYYGNSFVDEVWNFTSEVDWQIGSQDRNYLNNVFGVIDEREQQYIMNQAKRKFSVIIKDNWDYDAPT